VTFSHKNGELKRRRNCIVERENAFFKSSPVDEYHLPQMNSENVFFAIYSIFEAEVVPNEYPHLLRLNSKSIFAFEFFPYKNAPA
jgi:hypothetical protein